MLGFVGDAFDWTKKAVGSAVGAAGDVVDGVGEVISDAWNGPGGPKFDDSPAWSGTPAQYGGQYGADAIADMGFNRMGTAESGQAFARKEAGYAAGQMQGKRGPQAFENQDLADRESMGRYGDQNGALQLSREAAMGMAPSAAAYQMQAGLDRGLASQQAMQGSARGAAGIALAGGNAAANTANLQNQAFTQAGELRANEMAQGRSQYGGLAGQQRDQDLQRLGQGSQMSQYNAGLNDQYKMGMGQLGVGYAGAANQYGQQAQGWMDRGTHAYDQQMQGDMNNENNSASAYNQHQSLLAAQAQAKADAKQAAYQNKMGIAGTIVHGFSSAIPGSGGGGTPPPKG